MSPSKSHLNKWYRNGTDGYTNSMNSPVAFKEKSNLLCALGEGTLRSCFYHAGMLFEFYGIIN